MVWQALLRCVDFDRLLTAQADLAERLQQASSVHGPESEEARNARAGFNLLAKVLFTRRATIPDVHDLVWLDQLAVARDARPSKIWEGEANRAMFHTIASDRGRLGELIPRGRAVSWADVPVTVFGGSQPLKLERGSSGLFHVGFVTYEGCLELMSEVSPLGPKEGGSNECLREIWRLAMASRHAAKESAALVFASSSR
jgi:hypothetical protein